jgi:shikimate kinase
MAKVENIRSRNIIITGFMGTGKTTVGMLVAKRLNRTFIDTDELIESETGKSISDIFERYGECHFRKIEHLLFKSILATNNKVIATGGGTLVEEENTILTKDSIVFCLTARIDDLKQRLYGQSHRPLIQNDKVEKNIEKLLCMRQAAYDRISNQIITSDKKPEEIAILIIDSFRKSCGECQ